MTNNAESSTPADAQAITEHELAESERANQTGRPPVVFVHGLWLLPSSWDRWAKLFEDNGYAALTPGWPDDPETVEEAAAHPEVFAGKSVGQVADHLPPSSAGWSASRRSSAIPSGACFVKRFTS
jgi:non-heme chloroperoxidase